MVRKRPTKAPTDQGDESALRHVLIVGGTVAEWDALGPDLWTSRRSELGKAVAHAGAAWLTLRPYMVGPSETIQAETTQAGTIQNGGSPAASRFRTERLIDVREGCTVIVDPVADGRGRLLWAIEQLRQSSVTAVDESALTGVLMAPAPSEPDLTIVLGPSTRLPPSLVWELAYSEIVFIDTAWDELAAAHVEKATDEYSRRHRRFGGIE